MCRQQKDKEKAQSHLRRPIFVIFDFRSIVLVIAQLHATMPFHKRIHVLLHYFITPLDSYAADALLARFN
jgi:hypothetical protein